MPGYRVLVLDEEYRDILPEMQEQFGAMDIECCSEPGDLASYSALITQMAPVGDDLLGRMSGLKTVLKMGSNYSNIDAAAVRARGLTFGSVPRKGPNCVAELAMTLILALSKDLLVTHQSVADGAFRYRGLRPALTAQWKMAFHWMRHEGLHEVRGKTLGSVGMGEIGCELAKRARAMGMNVLYYGRRRIASELEETIPASFRGNLLDLMAESDYVSLNVPHTAETEKMIGKEELAAMKPTAFLVNTCRGGVVDEEALIECLSKRRIAGAGLDVFTYEPLPEDSPLCYLDNVILTPHVGGGTGTNKKIELSETLRELESIVAGNRPSVDLSRL